MPELMQLLGEENHDPYNIPYAELGIRDLEYLIMPSGHQQAPPTQGRNVSSNDPSRRDSRATLGLHISPSARRYSYRFGVRRSRCGVLAIVDGAKILEIQRS